MQKGSLTFLSSRGTGLNADLKLVEKYFTTSRDGNGMSFRFFLNNERSENPMVRQGFARAKIEFCERMTNVICADGSLSANLKELDKESTRLLLAVPYDYQFKNARPLKKQKGEHTTGKTFQNFTHIIMGSPFSSEIFRSAYDLEGIQLIEDICMPFVWDINQPERQKEIKDKLQFYFPAIEKKKILTLLFYGEPARRNGWIREFDLRALLEKLGEGWFVITNLQDFVESAFVRSSSWKDSFGYVNHIMPGQDLLYAADVMVTNNGRFASYFTSRGKNVYCPGFRWNSFEYYMRDCYPDMFLNGFGDLLKTDIDNWGKEQQIFHEQMTYKDLRSPYEAIGALFA